MDAAYDRLKNAVFPWALPQIPAGGLTASSQTSRCIADCLRHCKNKVPLSYKYRAFFNVSGPVLPF